MELMLLTRVEALKVMRPRCLMSPLLRSTRIVAPIGQLITKVVDLVLDFTISLAEIVTILIKLKMVT
jgi:hypothetical protein